MRYSIYQDYWLAILKGIKLCKFHSLKVAKNLIIISIVVKSYRKSHVLLWENDSLSDVMDCGQQCRSLLLIDIAFIMCVSNVLQFLLYWFQPI